ncbi:MAG: glycosyltransferase family 2 protein [Pseudomonadota bacterium]
MDISVILATYKRPQILSKTLESFCALETDGLEWEVIVVDNAGDPDSQKTVEGFQRRLPLRFFVEKTPGKNNALNHGIKKARGELFVFTDDDILADPGWLIETWEGMGRWPEFSMFGGKVLPKFPAGKIPLSVEDKFFKDAYVIADWDIIEGPYQAKDIWGPNMGIRAEVFHLGWSFNPNIGPKGKNYLMGSETEFTTRLEKAGFKSVYLPNSLVYHQIRPEQLKVKWLYGRAFKDGRRLAYEERLHEVRMLFGVPEHLFRQLIKVGIKRALYFFDRKTALQLGIRHWRIWGMVYQYRQQPSCENQ